MYVIKYMLPLLVNESIDFVTYREKSTLFLPI